jgi:hypothetical protein
MSRPDPKGPPYKPAPFRRCEFCGCNTNAFVRACCDQGRAADTQTKENPR